MRRWLEEFLIDSWVIISYFIDKILTSCEFLCDSMVKFWHDPFLRMMFIWWLVLVLFLLGE